MSEHAHQGRRRAVAVRHRRPAVEPLEGRQFFSATLAGGVWTIAGDATRDRRDEIVIAPAAGDAASLAVTVNGAIEGTVPVAGLTNIVIDAGKGNDRVTIDLGSAGAGVAVRVLGGKGNDKLYGGAEVDTFLGGSGNDRLDGGAGNDALDGGSGNDRITGGDGDDTLLGGSGNDVIDGGAGDDAIDGGRGRDRLAGGDGADSLAGAGGTDTLVGNAGADVLVGGRGTDRVFSEAGVDDVTGVDRKDRQSADDVRREVARTQSATDLKQWMIDAAVKQYAWAFGTTTGGFGYYRAADGAVLAGYAATDRTVPPASPPPTPVPVPGAPGTATDGAGSVTGGGTTTTGGTGTSSSGTNTQVAGVDEADLVETDGQYIYTLSGGEVVAVRATPAGDMTVVSRTAVEGSPLGLFLHDGRLTVLTGSYPYWDVRPVFGAPVAFAGDVGVVSDVLLPPIPTGKPKVRATVLDVADPAHPGVVEETALDGTYASSRMVGDKLYVVVRNDSWMPAPLPVEPTDPVDPPIIDEPPIVDPLPGGGGTTGGGGGIVVAGGVAATAKDASVIGMPVFAGTVYESEADYRARLAAMPLTDLLPGFEGSAGGETTSGLIVDGRDAFVRDLSTGSVGQNLTTVAMIDTGDAAAGPTATSTVAGWGGEVYASTGAIYLASGEWNESGSVTRLFKFDLTPDGVPLAATGQVPGSILSQYSMDESGGYFRIATNVWDDETGGQSNGVYVLGQSADKLEVVGSVTGIAKGESLRSSRFAGNRAYVVTFRQVDPLFSLDLSDPRDPQVTGQVKVPGFSSYLFPVSENLLIGVGRNADPDTQQDEGLQVSLFDVSDPDAPRRVAAKTLAGPYGYSEAEYDPHAFAYFADERIMTLPLGPIYGDVVSADGSSVVPSIDGSLLVVSVDPAKGSAAFDKLGEVATPGGVRRAVRIDGTVFAVGDTHIRSAPLTDPGTVLDTVELTAG